MKIAINALPAKMGGPLSHLANLLPELAKLDHENEYVIFAAPDKLKLFETKAPNFRLVSCPRAGRSLAVRMFWEWFVFPFHLYFRNFDLLYCPLSGSPLMRVVPQLSSVRAFYDEAGRLQRGIKARLVFLLRDLRVWHEVHTSSAVITVSEWAKHRASEHYGVKPDRITVVYHGRSRAFQPEGKDVAGAFVRSEFGVEPPYVLVAGDLYPHKNYELTVAALERVREAGHKGLKLIWAGTIFPGQYSDWVMADVKRRKLEDVIRFVGRVGAETLRHLYCGSECLMFLSRVETFGQPLVEAMSCEVPIVASTIPAMKEIAGDAALFCDVDDEETCTKNLTRVLEEPGLREAMVERGRQRRETFSWERTARRMLELFRRHTGRTKDEVKGSG